MDDTINTVVREGVDYVDRTERAKLVGEIAPRPNWMRDPKPSLPPRPPSVSQLALIILIV